MLQPSSCNFARKQTNRHYRKQYLTVHRQGNVII